MLISFWLLSPIPEEEIEHVRSASLFACFRDKELSDYSNIRFHI